MTTYYVWRRSDGYVASSANGMPRDFVTGGSEPESPGGPRPGNGIPVTFEKLGEFTEWNDARKLIIQENRKRIEKEEGNGKNR